MNIVISGLLSCSLLFSSLTINSVNQSVYQTVYSQPSVPEISVPAFPTSLIVGNTGELSSIPVYSKPSSKSKIVGNFYGSLMGVKVLSYGETFNYIETTSYNSSVIVQGYARKSQLKTIHPRKDWGVLVNINEQKLYIYKNGKLVKSFLVSTGDSKTGNATPKGQYVLGSRGKSFYSSKYQQGAYNWVRFNKGYLFHSIVYDKNGKFIESEIQKLGKEASHGCIRMPLEESNWFYNNVPENTPLIIQ